VNTGELTRLRSGAKCDALATIARAADRYRAGRINPAQFVLIVGREIGMDDPPLPTEQHRYEASAA